MATDGTQPPVLPYLTLFNAIDQGFCIIEVLFDDEGNAADYRFLEVNPAFKQQTGIENAVGRRMREIAPQHEAHWFELYGRIALTGEVASFEQRADQLGNRWYDGYAFRVGKPEERQVAIVFKDITNYKRAEEALQASEAQLRRELEDTKTLHELSKLFIKEENSESLYEQLLSAAVALMGADCASIQLLDEERQQLRLLAWKGFHPEAAAYWQTVALGSASVCSRAVRSGERLLVPDVRVSTILVGSDSHKYYQLSGIVAVQSTPLIAQSGRLVGMISTHWRKPHAPSERELRLLDVLARQAADMLERKQAEEALRQTQESLAVALEAAGMSIWDLDLHTLKARTNLRQNQNIDYTEPGTEWDLDLFRRLVIPQDQARAKAAFDQAMVSGEFDLEVRVYRLDGQVRWLHNQGHVHFNKAGIPIRMSGVTQDITERKQAEERLRTSDERFRRYFELGLIGMAISSPTKGMVEVNDELCRILGYTRSDLLQMTWADVTHPDDLAANVAQFNRVMAGEIDGYTLDKRCIRKDGQVIDTTLSVQCVRRSDGAVDYNVVLLHDITERKQAEERLRASEERFRRYFELGLIGMAISSPTKEFVEVNDEICRIYGYPRSELLQMTWAELTHPDYLAADVAQLGRVMAGEIDGYTLDKRFIRKDGRVIDATISVKCLRRGDGAVDYFVGLLQDITERKQAEENQARLLREVDQQRILLRRLNQTLARAQEEERQELARELHDRVGQNLTALNLNLKLIQNQLRATVPTTDLVDASLDEARQLVEQLTVQVRDVMSDLRPPMLTDYGLPAALRWYATQFARRTGLAIAVQGEQAFPRPSEETELNLFRIAQEAFNNAAKYAQATHLTVSLAADDQHIRLTVADNGHGMVVADPTDSGPPQRWGLLIMRERAKAINGQFVIHSAPNEGTTITVEVKR